MQFFKSEFVNGVILFIALVVALLIANSPLLSIYQSILYFSIFSVRHFPLFLVNDMLMTIFFMSLALEIKREIIAGHLSKKGQLALPCIAALGGVVIPALIFAMLNYNNPLALKGWAIPTATDVALVLGVIALLGKRIPVALKVFLVTLAIVDDIVAIGVIAVFYTQHIFFLPLVIALAGVALLILLNCLNYNRLSVYMLIGIFVWLAVLHSGIHATLAGVAVGLCIPYKKNNLLVYLEEILKPWIAYLILPLFVLANAGIPFNIMDISQLSQSVPMGIVLGLFIGKQLGIFIFSYLLIKSNIATLPAGASWRQLYGIAILGGIGFTMSLFISNLAYSATSYELISRAGILLGSLLSLVVGIVILFFAKKTS